MWGLGFPSSTPVPSHGALEASPSAGSGDWGAGSGGGLAGGGGGGGGGLRGRGVRGSTESSTGAREAHAYAQAAASAAPAEAAVAAAVDEEERGADTDRERFLEGGRASTSTVQDFPRIVEALSCYKRVHGHVRMVPAFKVPPNAPWPEHLYGMDLGRMVRQGWLGVGKGEYLAVGGVGGGEGGRAEGGKEREGGVLG